MEKIDKTLTFVPYNDGSEEHKKEITKFHNDLRDRVDGYDRFIKFGLLGVYSVKEILDMHAPIFSLNEKVKRYLVYDGSACVGITILDWCTLDAQNTNALNVFYLLIKPSEMHKGYGTKIMKELMTNGTKLIGENFSEINLSVNVQNSACQNMCEKLGFNKEAKSGDYFLYSFKQNKKDKNFGVANEDVKVNGNERQKAIEDDSIDLAFLG